MPVNASQTPSNRLPRGFWITDSTRTVSFGVPYCQDGWISVALYFKVSYSTQKIPVFPNWANTLTISLLMLSKKNTKVFFIKS